MYCKCIIQRIRLSAVWLRPAWYAVRYGTPWCMLQTGNWSKCIFFKLRNFMENKIAVWMQPQIWSKLTFFLYPFQSNLFVAALSRCLQWLVEHGADTTTPDLNGNTPQQLLGAGDHSDVAYGLMDLWGGSELPPFPNSRSQLQGSYCNWQGCDSDG